MNYFHRKAFLHLLERRDKVEESQRGHDQRIQVQEYQGAGRSIGGSSAHTLQGGSPGPVRTV